MFRLFIVVFLIGATIQLYAAEIETSEVSQHQVTSLPTPQNLSLNAFGQWIIGWGTGAEGARQRLDNIRREDVAVIKQKGTTLDMIKVWQKYYEQELENNLENPTARYRAKLMKRIADLW
ncbi:DUF4951 domain-containing protein [Acinetobacter sp. VNK23]|uniref:DUF4951 domain-containing protein n=1 Tax=Acinetobacter thutiue TaxID=2998078 RepID=UPI0025780A75|nr:DUF4951 domain-containing protein [Acinetobacter thutiue]MDM1020762.1 DUF4951 domain-containing protein [Acinetobacter thutiue]